MKAMILAAGVGSRLRPLTDSVPKPMLPIAGQPLLVHTLQWLHAFGVDDIALNLHYLPDVVQQGLGDGKAFGVRLRYSVEHALRGTAGALLPFTSFFDQTFVVVYGDLLVNLDLHALLAFHRNRQALVTVALKPTDDPQSQGMIECDATGRVQRFVEKPADWPADENLANAGVYIVEPSVLRFILTDRPSDWGHDIFPLLLAAGLPVYACLVAGQVVDIGTHQAYERVRQIGLAD